ncbi:hypothetical protein [Sphingobium sp. B11D3D]|uniref:hypothetical protein n=1 Tax=Sphingobium sp. B11D3D TaxID=2940576 RepID=UPI002223F4A3|nr:hypothetical protein [Sphingobium sp. B11D3D]MCW2370205.1 type II secretory pathway pseudopilin PulG [Sphingobium sp. B11D3D]
MSALLAKARDMLAGSRLVPLALIVIVAVLATLTIAKCTGGKDRTAAQAQQTTRSAEAIANAAQAAIDQIGNQAATERAIETAIGQAQGEISNAQTVNDIRDHVLDRLCAKPSHRGDPACALWRPHP